MGAHFPWKIPAALAAVALCACAAPQQAPAPVPELSTEVVNMSLSSPEHLARLELMLAAEPPAHAELACSPESNRFCAEALSALAGRNVPVIFVRKQGRDLTLIYRRGALPN